MTQHFLEVRDVSKIYRIGGIIGATKIAAVDHVNLILEGGKPQILSLVGESGSGKTTIARMIARLIQPTSGEILIDGQSTSGFLGNKEMKAFRRKVQPIFQNPFESFSSRKTVETYLFETARNILGTKTKADTHRAVDEALASVTLGRTCHRPLSQPVLGRRVAARLRSARHDPSPRAAGG